MFSFQKNAFSLLYTAYYLLKTENLDFAKVLIIILDLSYGIKRSFQLFAIVKSMWSLIWSRLRTRAVFGSASRIVIVLLTLSTVKGKSDL